MTHSRHGTIFVGAILSIVVSATCAAQEIDRRPDLSFPAGRSSVAVPAQVFNNVVYLPVMVNGDGPFQFALDTGAPDLSAVDRGLSVDLGLAAGSSLTVHGSSRRKLDARRIEGVSLSIGGLEADDFELIALPLESLEPYWGHPMDGILGGNILHQLVTCIDYDRGQVTFSSPEAFDPAGHGEAIPIAVEENTLFVPAAITARDGRPAGRARLLIDTGVRQSFLNTPFVRRHRLIERSGEVVVNVTGFGISGAAIGTVGRLGSVTLGSYAVEGPIVQLCTEDSGIEASTRFDGIIGADLLSRFKVCFDYRAQRLHLEPGAAISAPFASDGSGLVFKASAEGRQRFSVAYVVDGSPAGEAGIQAGDVLLSLGGRPAEAFSLESLKIELQGAGETCLQLLRDRETHEICLELRPLIT